MNSRINSLFVIIGAFCVAPLAAHSQPKWKAPNTLVIVKLGESVGGIRIGMNPHEAHVVMGQPSSSFTITTSRHPYQGTESWCDKGKDGVGDPSSYFVVVYYWEGKIENIAARLPKAELLDGFPMDSKFADIKTRFDKLEYHFAIPEEDVSTQGYQDKNLGIAFFYGAWNQGVRAHIVANDEKPYCFEVLKQGENMSLLDYYPYNVNYPKE